MEKGIQTTDDVHELTKKSTAKQKKKKIEMNAEWKGENEIRTNVFISFEIHSTFTILHIYVCIQSEKHIFSAEQNGSGDKSNQEMPLKSK